MSTTATQPKSSSAQFVELDDVEIPARLLWVTACRGKHATKFAINCVLIDTWDDERDILAAVATDGRRLIAARWQARIPDDFEGPIRLLVPGEVAAEAARLAGTRGKDDEPMAVLRRGKKGGCKLTVFADDGPVVFEWQESEAVFPPYRDIIPTFDNTTGVARLGIFAKPVATTLLTIRKVVGDVNPVRVYLPETVHQPVGMEVPGEVGDVQITALVMQARIEEWTEKPAEEKTADVPGQMTIDEEIAARQQDENAWRLEPISKLGLRDGTAGLLVSLSEMKTLGDVAAWAANRYEPKVQGIGKGKQQEIDDALVNFHMARAKPLETPAGPIDPATTIVAMLKAADGAGVDLANEWLTGVLNTITDDAVAGQLRGAMLVDKGINSLQSLADAFADGDEFASVFPGLPAAAVDALVAALGTFFAPGEPATPDFVTTFPEPASDDARDQLVQQHGAAEWSPELNAKIHAGIIGEMVGMSHAFDALHQRSLTKGVKKKEHTAIKAERAKISEAATAKIGEYTSLYGAEAYPLLRNHVTRLAAAPVADGVAEPPAVEVPPLLDDDEPGNTPTSAAWEPAGFEVDDDDLRTPTLEDVELTIEELEASRGAVRPSDRISANLQATWNSTVGVPVHLAGVTGTFAVTKTTFGTGAVTYEMRPLLARDPSKPPAANWGKRRSQAEHADLAPMAVPLAGVACTAADGTPYVFGADEDVYQVEVPRTVHTVWQAKRQAQQDVADHARGAKKRTAVPA